MCIADSVGRGGVNHAADVKTVQVLLNLNLPRLGIPSPLGLDGIMGNNTVTAIEALQTRARSAHR